MSEVIKDALDPDAVEALADAWASIDGKLEDFRAGKNSLKIEDFGGHYAGYTEEAHEMIVRLRKRGFDVVRMEAADA